MKLISQGAEAKIYETQYILNDCILKKRIKKYYRHPDLDQKLNQERLKSEVKNLDKARKLGVNTPYIIYVDKENLEIYMQKIQNAMKVKDFIFLNPKQEKLMILMQSIGYNLAQLHNQGLIHGDLTTSNFILSFHTDENKQNLDYDSLYFIDFGLSYIKNNMEDKAVDLYVLGHFQALILNVMNNFKNYLIAMKNNPIKNLLFKNQMKLDKEVEKKLLLDEQIKYNLLLILAKLYNFKSFSQQIH